MWMQGSKAFVALCIFFFFFLRGMILKFIENNDYLGGRCRGLRAVDARQGLWFSWPYSFPSVAGMMVVSIFFFFLFVFVWSPGTFICIFPTRAMAAAWPVGFFRGINTHGFGKDKKYSCSLLNLPRFVPGLLSSCLPKVGCWPMAVYETCLFWHAALSSAGPLSFAMSQSCTLQVFERFEGSSEREEQRLRIHTINL